MPRKATAADSDNTVKEELPTCSGAHLEFAQWFRDLLHYSYLFEADVAFFLASGSSVTNNGKTAVLNTEHGLLLGRKIIKAKNYYVLNPPPIDDAFAALYAQGAPAGTAKLPLATEAGFALSTDQILAPDRILQLDMKLRNIILGLITARGRRSTYAMAFPSSGCALLAQLLVDSKISDSAFIQNPHTRRLKANLEELLKLDLLEVSQVEFDEIHDQIEEINGQLEDPDKMSDARRCDHYLKLINNLGSQPIRLALNWGQTHRVDPTHVLCL